MKQVTIVKLKENLSDIISEVAFGEQDYVLSRHGRDVVVMISKEKWEKFVKLSKKFVIVD